MFWITFIFYTCQQTWAAAAPVNYECDIGQVTGVLTVVNNPENNWTEEIGLIKPNPDVSNFA